MRDEIDTEINGYTPSYYFSLFADLEKAAIPAPRG